MTVTDRRAVVGGLHPHLCDEPSMEIAPDNRSPGHSGAREARTRNHEVPARLREPPGMKPASRAAAQAWRHRGGPVQRTKFLTRM
jgi:hypothetical protein